MHAVTGTGKLLAGRYRLEDPIGRGAMGIVWRGRDELLARAVAVKEVQITAHASPAEAEAIYQRTLREARTAARLNHPGVVTVYDVLEENGSPWIIMELVEARSLDRIIAEDGPLPPAEAAQLGTSLIGALATAHAAGVLHRDVKPSNVLVGSEGTAVLTDFGIATFAGDPGIAQAGMVVGTPGFTAPERVHGEAATTASDLWSAGATLYAAVEGRGPFDRTGGVLAVTAGVAREEAPRAPSAGPLGPVIGALLTRDPATRPDASTAVRLLAEAATAARVTPAAEAARAGEAAVDPGQRAGAGSARDAAFLDPPVYAELSMIDLTDPGATIAPSAGAPRTGDPVLPDDPYLAPVPDRAARRPDTAGRGEMGLGAGLATYQAGALAGLDGADAAAGADEAGEVRAGVLGFWRRNGAAPSPRRWQLTAAAAGAAVIVLAAIGWAVASGPPASQALQTRGTAGSIGTAAGGGQGSGGSGAPRPSTAATNPASGTPAGGASGTTTASHGQPAGSGSPGMSSVAGPGAGSPSPTPTISTPGTRVPLLPAGWVWHRLSAAALSSAAGFRLGLPSAWTQSLSGQIVHFAQPSASAHLSVSVAPWTYASPLAEAAYLQRKDSAGYNDYTRLSLNSAGFAAIGGFRPAPAAELRFRWHKPGAGSCTELVVLVSLPAASGVQTYAITLWAPSAGFGAQASMLTTALGTFRPLSAG